VQQQGKKGEDEGGQDESVSHGREGSLRRQTPATGKAACCLEPVRHLNTSTRTSRRDPTRMVEMPNPAGSAVAFAGPLVDAQRAWSSLRGHGFDAWLLNENEGTLYELGSVQVAVLAEELAPARDVLRSLGLLRGSPE
jgi:hypothetical protein